VGAAGFEKAEIVQKHNIFQDVPNPSSALEFGTQGISLQARKPKWPTVNPSSFAKALG
jgi:hypothetical protein